MKTQKRIIYIALAVVLCVTACFAFLKAKRAPDRVTLNVSLYQVIPEYDSFVESIAECWKEKHPEADLNFVDWDCYETEVPEDLDVFVIDTISLDSFAEKGYLLALSEEDIQDYDDLIPSFMEGCRVDGTIYVIPQFLCTDMLYTRKGDTGFENVRSVDDLHDILGDDSLLTDKGSASSLVCLYLQALIDTEQRYMDQYPPVEEGKLSPEAISTMEKLRAMRQTDPEGVPEGSSRYYYARRFSEGLGRVYIGYSESMSEMGSSASDMDFRLISMAGDEDIPVFYVDAAAVNAKISSEKKTLALELLNMITGKDALVRASAHGGDPLYLFTARYSVYDTLASDYPIYADLKEIATVPDAYPFRIRPDGVTYMEEAENNADALPPLSK